MADQLQLQIGADTQGLQQGLNRAEKAVKDFDATARRSSAAVGQAGQSLTNLGRIASDLPFGFIAIQNNLDPLIQSFGSLTKTSGGVGGALKALGGALIGPAGLALAFATVSTGITLAVQKYGSLGAAVSALIGKEDKLGQTINDQVKAYEKLSEGARTLEQVRRESSASVQDEIVKVTTLIGIIQSETATRGEKVTALNSLKAANKEYFGDLTQEALLTGQLTNRVNAYIDSLVKAAQVKNLTEEFLRQAKALEEINEAARLATQALESGNGASQRSFQALTRFGASYQEAVAPIQNAAAAVERFNEIGEKQFLAIEKYKELKQALADALVAQNSTKASIDQTATALTNNTSATNTNKNAQASLTAELAKQKKEWDELQLRLARLRRPTESDTDITQQFQAENPAGAEPRALPFDPLALIQGALSLEKADKNAAAFQERIKGLVTDFNDLLGPAINTIFGAIENGQNIFKALGQSLKALVVQLVATVAKAAILAAILSLIPGAGAALGVAGAAQGATGGFGGLFRNFLPSLLGGGGGVGRSAAPTFSGAAGINGGGIQLAGQVVFVQRGPDLVGVLNQGNARIGRVG
jgi:hypothetical protein